MKIEHREAIERARLHGIEPMVLAHQLMVHDLVEAALFELRNMKSPFGRLNEEDQQEVIDRITEKVNDVVPTAISIISSRSVDTIPIKIADSKFKEKSITVTGQVDAQDPNRHGLIDLSGKLALLVLAPNDYADGLDGIRGERDQRELPLSAAELAAGMGLSEQEPEEGAWGATDPLYQEAVDFVVESQRASISAVQRKLKIGYNRAARLIESLEEAGIVSAMNSNGARDVLTQTPPAQSTGTLLDDLNAITLDEVTQLVRKSGGSIDMTFLQQHLAVDSSKATSLLFQLVEQGVIAVENSDAANSADYVYKVLPFADAS